MKKPIAIALLIIGGLAAVFGLSFLCMLLFAELMNFGLFIDFVLVLGMAFGGYCISKLYRRKYGIGVSMFFLCAYVPLMICSGIYFTVILILDELGHFRGFMEGLGESLTALAFVAVSVVLAIAGGIWIAVANANS